MSAIQQSIFDRLPSYAVDHVDLIGLTDNQRNALELIDAAFRACEPIVCLQGFAGTGKTHCVSRYLIGQNRPVVLTAPTNKAVAVLRQMAAQIGSDAECKTIHAALGLRPQPNYKTGLTKLIRKRKPEIPNGALLVVDEASMIGSELLAFIDEAIDTAYGVQVLLVGDPAQLPPVGESSSPAFDLDVPTARLTEVIRQDAGHPVLSLATRIREAIDGERIPPIKPATSANGSIRVLSELQFETELLKHFKSEAYQNDPDYCRVLCWTNMKSIGFNALIRLELLGDYAAEMQIVPDETLVTCAPIIIDGEVVVSIGETVKVIDTDDCEHHKYGIPSIRVAIATPDAGEVTVYVVHKAGRAEYKSVMNRLSKAAKKLQDECNLLLESEKVVPTELNRRRKEAWCAFFQFKEEAFCDLRPPHSSTIHRSQGSTYGHVFIDLGDVGKNKNRNEVLRLLYVALTRPRGDVFVTGNLPKLV